MRTIEFEDLPPRYQQQALRQMAEQARKKAAAVERGRKYNNQPVERGQLHFDSKKEAARFDALRLMEQAGEISELRLQVEFTLQPAYTTTAGERVRAIRYLADFTYRDKSGALIVEDVKSRATRTRQYIMKKKLMQEKFGISIVEV